MVGVPWLHTTWLHERCSLSGTGIGASRNNFSQLSRPHRPSFTPMQYGAAKILIPCKSITCNNSRQTHWHPAKEIQPQVESVAKASSSNMFCRLTDRCEQPLDYEGDTP